MDLGPGNRCRPVAVFALCWALGLLGGCGKAHPTVLSAHSSPKPDPWILTCTDGAAREPAYLTNGLVGLRIGRDGTGVPSAFLRAGCYATDETILPLQNPLAMRWSILQPTESADYRQSLDMRTGRLVTSWSQPELSVKTVTLLYPTSNWVTQEWTFNARTGISIRLDYPGWDAAHLHDSWYAIRPARGGEPAITSRIISGVAHVVSDNDPSLGFRVSISTGQTLSIRQAWNLDPRVPRGPDDSLASRFLKNRWKTDLVIDGPSEDQQAVRSWIYYLRSSVSQRSRVAPSPMGLSSMLYKGHAFWDDDIWMFPALALLDPAAATSIAAYRLKRLPEAIANAGTSNSIRFPWESSVSGKEVAPVEMRNTIHITGDVAFMLNQAAALGLADASKAQDVVERTNRYYLSIATSKGSSLELRNTRGPDEYHVGDNDLYTNCLAQWALVRSQRNGGEETDGGNQVDIDEERGTLGLEPKTQSPLQSKIRNSSPIQAPKSKIQNPSYRLPHDSAGLLTFDGDPVRNYGQADAILSIYPLQNPVAERESKVMMQRFPPKTSPSSPAMTDSVEALIWARLGETDRAYQVWRKSWQDYSDHPLGLFSEQRGKDRTYFLTGAAGCLQTVLYGFLGFRIDLRKDPKAVWAKRLDGGYWLTLKPHLPRQWNSVTLENFTVLGKRYTLYTSHSQTILTRGEP